jgi:hypothetical protein
MLHQGPVSLEVTRIPTWTLGHPLLSMMCLFSLISLRSILISSIKVSNFFDDLDPSSALRII